MTSPAAPERSAPPIVSQARELADWINRQLHDLEIGGGDRQEIPGLLFDIATEHHVAIVHLVEARIYAGAFALVRIEFEAYVRGVWLSFAASDEQLDRFVNRDEIPRIGALIDAVEALEGFDDKILSGIMANAWKSMNGYAHSGPHQITRRIKEGTIEPNYGDDEIAEVLRFAGTVALMALAEIARMAGRDDLVQEVQGRIGPSEVPS